MDKLEKIANDFEEGFKSGMSYGWISVNDRLPEQNKNVIITYNDDCVDVAFLLHDKFYDQMYNIYDNVTYWMPMPKPPVK